MIVQKIEKSPVEIDVTGATLFSAEEAEKLPIELRKYVVWWWLRSPGSYSNFAAYVYDDGEVFDNNNGYDYYVVDDGMAAVRPALSISIPKSSNLKIGDVFEFGGALFKIISSNLAFCLTDIGNHCFRWDWEAKDANDYEKSSVKKFVDKWFDRSRSADQNEKGDNE